MPDCLLSAGRLAIIGGRTHGGDVDLLLKHILGHRPAGGETMLDATGRSVRDQAVAMKFTDMKSRVRQPSTGAQPTGAQQ